MKTKMKIAVVLIALIVTTGLGSAMLVGYISNPVHNDVKVTSPLEIADFTVGPIVAGNVTCLDVSVMNNANRNVCGAIKVAVADGSGEPFDCTGIKIEGEMVCCDGEHVTDCVAPDCHNGVFTFPCVCFTAGETEEFNAKIYANPALEPDDYDFVTVVVPCMDEGWNIGEDCECVGDQDAMCENCPGWECLRGDWE